MTHFLSPEVESNSPLSPLKISINRFPDRKVKGDHNNIRAENRHQQIVVNHELNISQKPTPPKSIYINHAIIKHNRSPAVNGTTHYSTPLRHLISKKKAHFRLFYETFAKYCVTSLPAEPTNLINSTFLDFQVSSFPAFTAFRSTVLVRTPRVGLLNSFLTKFWLKHFVRFLSTWNRRGQDNKQYTGSEWFAVGSVVVESV